MFCSICTYGRLLTDTILSIHGLTASVPAHLSAYHTALTSVTDHRFLCKANLSKYSAAFFSVSPKRFWSLPSSFRRAFPLFPISAYVLHQRYIPFQYRTAIQKLLTVPRIDVQHVCCPFVTLVRRQKRIGKFQFLAIRCLILSIVKYIIIRCGNLHQFFAVQADSLRCQNSVNVVRIIDQTLLSFALSFNQPVYPAFLL